MTYDPRSSGARCDACPLAGKRVVPPEGHGPIVIVGENPGKMEEQGGRPFIGPAGVKLNELLRKAGLPPREELRLTNAILCRPEIPDEFGKKRYDTKAFIAWLRKQNVQRKKLGQLPLLNPFECCSHRLKQELQQAEREARAAHRRDKTQFPNGAIVFPVGNFALAVITEIEKRGVSVMKYRGSVIPLDVLPPEPVTDGEHD